MSLESRVYSVLIVSASDTFNTNLSELFPYSQYQPILFTANVSEAKRHLAERNYDLILINSPLPDESGLRFAIDCCRSATTVVLLLTKSDIHDEVYNKVVPYGVFTLPKPTSKTIMTQALHWMVSARERLRTLEKKTLSVEDRIEEIRIVNRAKCLLISEQHMSEPEAHRYIEKMAMDHCISKRTVAEGIIKTYS